ncbi:hypothetical protein RB653_004445 [Dictyostelium firmibasis]|uniref:SET domain-containing protein n=1 Tax=Dictyostelium firmibasis TaxID=79012 RepID=A0AAN7YX72_9MYCE
MITDKCKLVNNNDERGNYVVSTNEIKVGELLFSEESFSSIPLEFHNKQYCFLCCKQSEIIDDKNTTTEEQTTKTTTKDINNKPIQCKFGCNMWFCSEECSNDMTHQLECSFITKFIESSVKNECDVSTCLLALRIIIKNKIQSEKYQETVGKLSNQKEKFLETNKSFIEKYENNFQQVFDQLKQENSDPSLLAIFNKDEFIELVCSIYVNSFAGLSNDFNRIPISNGYFYKPALLNHSCEPNIFFTVKDLKLEMRACKKIEKDQEIFDSYVDLLLPTIERQKILFNSKNFICKCLRCSDSTEGERYISSIYCFHCNDGVEFISPEVFYNTDTKRLEENWKCSNTTGTCKFNEKEQNQRNKDNELEVILSDIKEFKEFINGEDLLLSNVNSSTADQEMPIIENILKRLLRYERDILSKLNLNHQCWLLFHLKLSKTFEKLSLVYNNFDYLIQSIQHYKEMTRIVESILKDSTSGELVDCYCHLGRINEKYLLSLIKQRNQFIQLKLQNKNKEDVDIEKLNVDIKNLLKFINHCYLNSYNHSVLVYGNNHSKSIQLNEMVLKSNLKSTTTIPNSTTSS